MSMMDDRIPVTIITGFLGAGKTTLLNQLIKKYSEKKFAIIENEFGEIGVDSGLIVDAGETVFELANGCICCSLNSDFQAVIHQLSEGPYVFDHLLIETTGIADPMSIVRQFVQGGNVQFKYRMDSVVCVADAMHLEDMLEERTEVKQQLALSDIILLNKCSDVEVVDVQRCIELIEGINPMASVYPVSYGNTEKVKVLDTFAYSPKGIVASTLSYQPASTKPANKETQTNQHNIWSEAFVLDQPLNRELFAAWIQTFLYFNEKTIYRAKGILYFEDCPNKYILHSVQGTVMLEPGDAWDNEERQSKLVFIGQTPDRVSIKQSLEQLVAVKVSR